MLKRKKGKQEKNVKARRPKQGATGKLILAGTLLTVLVLLLAGAALFFLQQTGERSAADVRARLIAQEKVERVREAVDFYHDALKKLAASPVVSKLLTTGDPEALEEEERRLRGVLPGLKRIHLIPRDMDQGMLREERQFSYAALEMLSTTVSGGKASPAEVHAFNSKQRRVTLASPVFAAGGKQIAGVVMAEISLKPFLKIVRELEPGTARFELIQVSDGQSLTFAGSTGGEQSGRMPVPGTIWQIKYLASRGEAGYEATLLLAGVLAAAFVLIALALFLLGGRLRRGLIQDQESLIDMMRVIRADKPVRAREARIPELQAAFDLFKVKRDDASASKLRASMAEKFSTIEVEEIADEKGDESPGVTEADDAETGTPPGGQNEMVLSPSIFRAFDVAGVAGETLTTAHVYDIGRAIGTEAYAKGQQTLIVGRDGRASSPELGSALCRGLEASGRDVVDIGVVPTPVLYFATHFLGADSGVMVTGSHHAPDYNGLKIVIAGDMVADEGIQTLYARVESGEFLEGAGVVQEQDLVPDYIESVVTDIQMARTMKVVIDCGNGAGGVVAPDLFRALGCEVYSLYCDVDGSFPNHLPDPRNPDNLADLIAEVARQGAELGIAFDGDGDSFAVVTASGKAIRPDRLLMLFARDVLSRQPGADVIYDVRSSRHLAREILLHGGRPVMWKSGHPRISAKMKETGALLAGELDGHVFFKERWFGSDDALYACARLLEILSFDPASPEEVFDALPQSRMTPELRMDVEEGRSVSLIRRLSQDLAFGDAKIIDVDGLRAEFEDGWGLVQISDASDALLFRFEADSAEGMQRIQKLFRDELIRIIPGESLPF